jgi:hypothetical protein
VAVHKLHGKVAFEPGTAAGEGVTKQQLDTALANALNRANHNGSQTSATISDFNTAVTAVVTALLELGDAPAALNTLNEIAAALQDNPAAITDILAAQTALDGRIDTLEANSGSGPQQFTLAAGTSSVVTHGLARRVQVTVVEVATGQVVFPVVTGNNDASNTVTIDFGTTSIAANSHVVLIA